VRGHITFGNFNNLVKVTDTSLALWTPVLQQVANSQLVLLAPETSARNRVWEYFESRGIRKSRINFVTPRPQVEYLHMYHDIDIGLDTLPYNGHTTSLDSYWMGVPVVTLVGQTIVGRAGLSQLTNLGLPELITRTPEQFAATAVNLAADLPRLAALRGSLRERIQKSPLMDTARFAKNVEAAYRQMWRRWCENAA
jgi:predicted O-linked N-acetylglucosamine transferase (SPINDLY family)